MRAKAVKYFTSIVILYSISSVYSQDIFRYDEILSLKYEKKLEDAIKKAQLLLSEIKSDPYLFNLLGELYLEHSSIENREKAQNEFLKALNIDKNYTPALLNLGILKRTTGDYWNAIQYLERVLRLNPNSIEAYLELFKIYIDNNQKDSIEKSENLIDSISCSNFKDRENFVILGLLHKELGNFDHAEALLSEFLSKDSTDVKSYTILSEIKYKTKDYDKFTEYFYKTIEYTDSFSDLERTYIETEDLLNEHDKEKYLSLDKLSEKRDFLLYFWKRKDPDIFTYKNERLIEHMKRLEHVRKLYSLPVPKGYDERGKIYVRYGEPLEIFRSNTVYYQSGIYETRANETWTYFHIHNDLSFDFVEFGAIYREVEDLSHALTLIKNNEILQELYRQRSHLGNSFTDLSFSSSFEVNLMEFKSHREEAKSNSSNEYFHFEKRNSNLTFFTDIAQFKGDFNRSCLYIYSGISSKNLKFQTDSLGKSSAQLDNRIVLIDSIANRAVDLENHKNFLTSSSNLNSIQILLDINRVNLIPGNYQFGIEYFSEENNNEGFFQKDIRIKNFDINSLQISDILLAYSIASEETEQKFSRGEFNLIPMPSPVLSNNRQLGVYFEIYNLHKDDYGDISYEFTYDIIKEQEKRSIFKNILSKIKGEYKTPMNISSYYIRESESRDEGNLLFLDISTLTAGRYIIKVKIKDLTNNNTAETSKSFFIVESRIP